MARLSLMNYAWFSSLVTLLCCVSLLTGCQADENPLTISNRTIPQLVNDNNLAILNAALSRTGATTALVGSGTYTLFAPTDAAFQAYGFPNVNAINTAPIERVQQLLQYHIVQAPLPSSAIAPGLTAFVTSLTTATSDSRLYVTKTTSGTLSVNGARVLSADLQARNGIVHTIDQLLVPPLGNVLRLMQADTSLSLLVASAQRGGAAVTGVLSGTTAMTVFAPTNAAFRAAGYTTLAAVQAIPVATLTSLLTNHVVLNARAYTPAVTNGAILTTVGGGSLTITAGSGRAVSISSRGNASAASTVLDNTINAGGMVVQNRDVTAINGVVHKVDKLLLP